VPALWLIEENGENGGGIKNHLAGYPLFVIPEYFIFASIINNRKGSTPNCDLVKLVDKLPRASMAQLALQSLSQCFQDSLRHGLARLAGKFPRQAFSLRILDT
jgi:hypothetical protein